MACLRINYLKGLQDVSIVVSDKQTYIGVDTFDIDVFKFVVLLNILLSRSIIRSSGGYSNLGARGKNFQKFMLSEKKKRSDLGLDIFLPKSKCSLKKKKKKKKVFTSISPLISLFFSQNQGVL